MEGSDVKLVMGGALYHLERVTEHVCQPNAPGLISVQVSRSADIRLTIRLSFEPKTTILRRMISRDMGSQFWSGSIKLLRVGMRKCARSR